MRPRARGLFLPLVLLLIIFTFLHQKAQAQSATIRGVISDDQTGTPLELANILLENLEDPEQVRGTSTNRNGVYEFGDVAPGRYFFRVSYVGYRAHTDTLVITASDDVITNSIRMVSADEDMGNVDVVYNRRRENLEAGQQKIRQVDLQRVPTPAGSGDLASYLRTLPGVVATGDRGGQFFVRGGTPSENLSMIDGMTIYQPFHIVGFFSVFPEEMISNVDFFAGGFGPRYGDRTSSVLDVQLRNGDFEEKKFSASVSPFLAEGFFEGPFEEGNSSYMVLTRGSLIEQASRLHPEGEQPLRFNSQIVKVSTRNDKGATCSALGVRTFDRGKLDYDGGEVFQWNNFLLGGRCAIIPERTNVAYFDFNVGFSHTRNTVGENEVSERTSKVSKFNIDANYLVFLGEMELEYGFVMNMRWLNFNISEVFQYLPPTDEVFVTNAGYVKANLPIGDKINFQPGIRTSVFWSYFKPTFEPRLQVSWQPRGKVNERLNASVGYYLQPVAGVSDLRDAGTAFTAWMIVPETDEQTKAIHALLGWKQPIGRYLDFSVEGYHKWLENVPITSWSVVAQFNTNLTMASGRLYGSDMTLKFNSRHVYASFGYGYSITEYETTQEIFEDWFGVPSQTYNPAHDRRHQLNAQAGLNMGNFKFNVGWNYGSGLPYSRPFGFDSHIPYWQHIPDVKELYGTPRILMNRPFNGRMPDYHSLNVSVEQGFDFDNFRMNIQVGSINTYDQENLFYYDVQTQRRINQLPIYPYVSLKVETN